MEITVQKDGDGFLAQVEGQENLFAFAYTKAEAVKELDNVIEMIMDYHLEQIKIEKTAKSQLEVLKKKYAV